MIILILTATYKYFLLKKQREDIKNIKRTAST